MKEQVKASLADQAKKILFNHSRKLGKSMGETLDTGSFEHFTPSGNRSLGRNPLSPVKKLTKGFMVIIGTNTSAKAVIMPENNVPKCVKDSVMGSLLWGQFIKKPNSYRQQIGDRTLILEMPDGSKCIYFGYNKISSQIVLKEENLTGETLVSVVDSLVSIQNTLSVQSTQLKDLLLKK